MLATLGLALIMFGSTNPGALITLQANCTYTSAGISSSTQAPDQYLGVKAPASLKLNKPVYLARGYHLTSTGNNGSMTSYMDSLANGLIVRFIRKEQDGQLHEYEGLQLSDGRVMVDGVPMDRQD